MAVQKKSLPEEALVATTTYKSCAKTQAEETLEISSEIEAK